MEYLKLLTIGIRDGSSRLHRVQFYKNTCIKIRILLSPRNLEITGYNRPRSFAELRINPVLCVCMYNKRLYVCILDEMSFVYSKRQWKPVYEFSLSLWLLYMYFCLCIIALRDGKAERCTIFIILSTTWCWKKILRSEKLLGNILLA